MLAWVEEARGRELGADVASDSDHRVEESFVALPAVWMPGGDQEAVCR